MTSDISKLTGKRILVTGGAGFIGSNLVDTLLDLNNEVICFDNLSRGYYRNIEHNIPNPNFSFYHGDIRDLQSVQTVIKNIDIVFHLAALGSVPRSIEDPFNTHSVNLNGFLNVLYASKEEGIDRFIYATSSSAYGDLIDYPKVEEKTGKPVSPYAITKVTNELYAEVFANLYGIEVIGLRFFNVFGKRQDPKGDYAAVIPKFVSQLLKGESPVINGDGSYSRDFTHIDNVVDACLLSATADKTSQDGKTSNVNTIYNVACGASTSLIELVEILKELLSQYDPATLKIPVEYGATRPGDIPHSLASIDKAKKLLGYQPKHNVKMGLESTCDWYWKNSK